MTHDDSCGELTISRLRLPLIAPFVTSFGTQRHKDVLIVSVAALGETGWGECTAPADPGYSEEYLDSAAHVIEHFLVPRMDGATGAPGLAAAFADIRGHRMAKAAVEMAVLDLDLKLKAMSYAQYFGATRSRIEAGVSVGIQPSERDLIAVVSGYLERGYRRIKLKVAPGRDIEPVRAIRREFGADLALQIDANCAYDRSHLRLLKTFDDFGLELIEQPFGAADLETHAALASTMMTPICLDESIHSAQEGAAAIRRGACSIINIKPGRVGGYLEARRLANVGHAMGAQVWCGGMVDTGIARAANVAFAATPELTLPGDTSESARFFAADITPAHTMVDGYMAVPDGPGIGVDVLVDEMRRYEVSHQIWTLTPTKSRRGRTRVMHEGTSEFD